ncbi:MAG TPA: N-acetylglucosamine-6-phosphate deacetylase [Ktedonobacterales bacterium]|nr:N-acetylglucosamine-6-phosphate deacetylase [Ktedonobacterales bacterium]
MKCTLHGARLVDASGDLPSGDLRFDGANITDAGAALTVPEGAIDATDMIVMPGFIDVHTHGGGGRNLHTADPAEIGAYARWAPSTGVTSFLVGVVGTPGSLPEAQLAAAAAAIEHREDGAQPLGIHLEGPYINERRRGAHLPSWVRTPDTAETERVLALSRGHLRIVTLAPELPGASAMIRRLADAGVTVSLGHSDATYEQALEAISLGVTHVTHCCNAMRPLLHRDPGPLSALSESPTVFGEVIVDGVHVHPAMVRVLLKLVGPERMIIITDALAGAGTKDATFEFGGQSARVIRGAARLADGTLTGSVLTMEQALRNVMRMTGVTLSEASGMLARNPAHAARVADSKGLLQPGYDADVVVLDQALTLHATYCRGELAFASDAWRVRASISDVTAL